MINKTLLVSIRPLVTPMLVVELWPELDADWHMVGIVVDPRYGTDWDC